MLPVTLLLCAGVLHAQTGELTRVAEQGVRAGKQAVEKVVIEEGILQAATRSTVPAITAAQQFNETLYNRLAVLFEERQIPLTEPVKQFPGEDVPIAFMVQKGEASAGTASAFAVERNGRLFGVTAAHVLNNIEKDPYMMVRVARGITKSVPISTWRKGNAFNVDVAVFEIPQEAAPYVQPLPIAEQPLQAHQSVSIAGFTHNLPLWFPQEEVLFVGAQRALIRSSIPQVAIGTCGGPVLADGKVVGVYSGFTSKKDDTLAMKWTRPLAMISTEPLPSVHNIVPIDQVIPFVQSLLDDTPQATGTMLRALNFPVTILGPEDHLVEINLMRDGDIIQSIYAGPLADPEHLEQFLNIEPDDVLSVYILRKNNQLQIYSVELNTGKVTHVL